MSDPIEALFADENYDPAAVLEKLCSLWMPGRNMPSNTPSFVRIMTVATNKIFDGKPPALKPTRKTRRQAPGGIEAIQPLAAAPTPPPQAPPPTQKSEMESEGATAENDQALLEKGQAAQESFDRAAEAAKKKPLPPKKGNKKAQKDSNVPDDADDAQVAQYLEMVEEGTPPPQAAAIVWA